MTRLLNRTGWVAAGVLTLLLVAALASVIHAGPLDPPSPGPPAPTGKGEIFSLPYTISAPGSYVVMADLTCTSCSGGASGITVAANDVTLDLNGFTIRGVAGSGSGITDGGTARSNVEIRNGGVSSWGGNGVYFASSGFSSTGDVRVTGADVAGNSGSGVYLVTCQPSVTGNTISSNGGYGIYLGSANCANGNIARANRVAHNNVTGNGWGPGGVGPYVDGIQIRIDGFVIEENAVGYSANNGIDIAFSAADGKITGNYVSGSAHSGILVAGFGNLVEGNHVTHNGVCSNDEQIRVPTVGSYNVVVANRATYGACDYFFASSTDAAPITTAAAATSPLANIAE